MTRISPILVISAVFAVLYGLGVMPDETPFYHMLSKGLGVTLLALYAARQKLWGLTLALGLGALGDVFLASPVTDAFIYGLGAFLLGHVVYIYLLWQARTPWADVGQMRRGLVGVVLVTLALMGWHLWPNLGADVMPVLVYMAVLASMTVLAQTARLPYLALGAFLFYASDVILGLHLFSGDVDMPRWINWWVYYPAQLLLCLGFSVKEKADAH